MVFFFYLYVFNECIIMNQVDLPIGYGSQIIPAAVSLAGSAINGYANYKAQESANVANKELAEYQYLKSQEAWNAQNTYNLPVNQMQRLKDAGLNPNLVYGKISDNVAAPAPQYNRPEMKAYTGLNLGVNDAAQLYMTAKMNQAQIANMQEQNELIKSQNEVAKQSVISEGIRQAGMLTSNSRSSLDLDIAKELKQTSIEAAKANLDKVREEILKIPSDVQLNQVQIKKLYQDIDIDKFNQTMNEMGIQKTDALPFRFVARIFRRMSDKGYLPQWLDYTKW
jgi:hypothetical protein